MADDSHIIARFNAHLETASPFTVQTQVLPEPFIGDPTSLVYVLALNPGYSASDDEWHARDNYSTAILANLHHESSNYPFYFYDPRFSESPGARWWRRKTRWLIDDLGCETLSQNIFCVQLFPYHSTRYRRIPNQISPNGLVPSSEYSIDLVRNAIRDGKTIIAMRAFRQWCKEIPELSSYPQCYRTNSAQNVSLSPNNLASYRAIVEILRDAA